MPAGRPSLPVTENTYAEITRLASLGMNQENIAACLNWGSRTWYRKKAKDERIMAAYQRGLAIAAMLVGESLLKQCIAGNISAIKWWERTRLGYSEKPKVEPNPWEGKGLSSLLAYAEASDQEF